MLTVLVTFALLVAVRPAAGAPPVSPTTQRAILDRYCVTCHSQRVKTAGLALEGLEVTNVATNAETWEKVVRKLRGGLMPPAGLPRPDLDAYAGLLSWLETELDRAAAARPNPGRTESLHRLNRAEYRNVIRDLLSLDVDVSALLPQDDASYGFDNIAGVQRMSPTLLERYLKAAERISSAAVGVAPDATTHVFRAADDLLQNDRLEGLPFGTRGGMRIEHTFAADGEYIIRAQLARAAGGSPDEMPSYDEPQELEVSIDGQRAHVFRLAPSPRSRGEVAAGRGVARRLDADWELHTPIKAGRHTVTATFLNRAPALLENLVQPFRKPFPGGNNGYYTTMTGAHLRTIEISGPFGSRAAVDTPSRRRIFYLPSAFAFGFRLRTRCSGGQVGGTGPRND